MKLGLVVRADNRGLGTMTWEAARHLDPDRVLVIAMGRLSPPPFVPERYQDHHPTVVSFDGHRLPEEEVRAWLKGLDVVWSAETLYDWRLADWARDAGARTVVMTMPEFFKHQRQKDLPWPDVWWTPTPWRYESLPLGTVIVPNPVALDRWPDRDPLPPHEEGPLRVLHPAGKLALADRNGTRLMLTALRMVRQPLQVTISSQDGNVPRVNAMPTMVKVKLVSGDRPLYWQGYQPHHLCVIPRSYGGLCLPAQEACAAGLGLIMTKTSPNGFPAALVQAEAGQMVNMPCGPVQLQKVQPRALALLLDELAQDRDQVGQLQWDAYLWAESHSWEVLLPLWMEELEKVAAG